ncbi:MAG: deacylase [Gemmatimonadetes bacterium RBG_16_66_8]|nr:MAG: deacylase [Gemmatimonadetes bacterium RBG_16_66_8]
MPVHTLKKFLDEHHIKYVVISHSPAYTAQEIAASAHVRGKELAKTVMLKVDGHLAMAVLPASRHIDFELLRKAVGARTVGLASEREFKGLFPECEVGAMPPFGNLYGLKTYVADALAEDDTIAFNAGTHTELIRMPYGDFARLVNPMVLEFAASVR